MTTLAVDSPRVYELGEENDIPVIASDIIYEGAAVGDNGSGYARPLVAGDPFRGFASAKANNASGSAGDIRVKVKSEGRIQLNISGLAITDVGKPVYASDDDTFTLTATSNSYIGRVERWVSTGVGIVQFDAAKAALGAITAITDLTGGNAAATNYTGATGTYSAATQGIINDNFAILASKLNVTFTQLK